LFGRAALTGRRTLRAIRIYISRFKACALPYLEEGELTTEGTWMRIMNLFGDDFFRYFIWFN